MFHSSARNILKAVSIGKKTFVGSFIANFRVTFFSDVIKLVSPVALSAHTCIIKSYYYAFFLEIKYIFKILLRRDIGGNKGLES